jgi:hypothetical protein
MFGSPSIKIHILRGLLGFGFLALVLLYGPAWGWWTLLPAAGALVSFGGCPTCWLVGLAGTFLKRLDGEPISLCIDGSCKKPVINRPC